MASVRFWQAWTIGSLCCCAAFAARLAARPAPIAAAPAAETAIGASARRAPSHFTASIVQEERLDPRLSRLNVAETGSELCDLLSDLEPSDDDAVADAITSVLERARFRSVRACATRALAAQRSPVAHSWLVDLAEDPQPGVHAAALDALAPRTDTLAISAVAEAAHSDDLDVRTSAVAALLRARRAGVLGAARELAETLDEPSSLRELIEALGASGDAQALPILRDLIARGDPLAHVQAIEALGELGASGATVLLEPYFRVSSPQEFRAAALALVRLAPQRAHALLEAVAHDEDAGRGAIARDVLLQSKARAADEVSPRTPPDESTEPEHDEPPPPPAADDEPLENQLLAERDPELRHRILDALVSRGDPHLVETFRRAATDEDSSVRQAALLGLSTLGDPSAEARLAELARASEEYDRLVAVAILGGRADDAATAALEGLTDDSVSSVAAGAIGELKTRRPERAAAIAERRFTRAPEDRLAMLDAVAELPTRLVMPLYAKALADGDDAVALRAIEILNELEGPMAAQQLLAVARDSARSRDVRVTAARVLRGLGGRLARDNQRFLDDLREPDERELDAVSCWGHS